MVLRTPTIDLSFPHSWQAELLDHRPLILPARHHTYPQVVEEVERGALEILLRPAPGAAPILLTFALGFAEPTLPHGLWSCPSPAQLCAVAGGYAYLVDTRQPEQWQQVPYRPVTIVQPALQAGLLLFASFHQLWALGPEGMAWETAKLSWEGLRITGVEGHQLTGMGWDLPTDREVPFTIDLRTGQHTGGPSECRLR